MELDGHFCGQQVWCCFLYTSWFSFCCLLRCCKYLSLCISLGLFFQIISCFLVIMLSHYSLDFTLLDFVNIFAGSVLNLSARR